MAAAAILKNLKIAISQPHLGRFWQNLARWCSSTILTAPTVKNLNFLKSRWGGRHLEKSNNRHISAVVLPILTKFGMVKHFEPLDCPDGWKFEFSKIQDGGGRQFEKFKNSHVSAAFGPGVLFTKVRTPVSMRKFLRMQIFMCLTQYIITYEKS